MRYIFRYISTTRGCTPKRTTPSDSAHRIGPSTLSKEVLTVEEGVCGWRFQNRKIRHIFRHISTTRACTSKWTMPLDSAHRTGPSTLSKEDLTVDEGVSGWGFENGRISNGFASTGETSRDRAKRMVQLDSAHRIGVSTLSRGVLNVDAGVGLKMAESGRFLLMNVSIE